MTLPLVSKGSLALGLTAGDSSSGLQGEWTSASAAISVIGDSQVSKGSQASVIPRQAVLVPPCQEEVGKSGTSSCGNSSSISVY